MILADLPSLRCPACGGVSPAAAPLGLDDPVYRCSTCSVRFVVTNKSYLPDDVKNAWAMYFKENRYGYRKNHREAG